MAQPNLYSQTWHPCSEHVWTQMSSLVFVKLKMQVRWLDEVFQNWLIKLLSINFVICTPTFFFVLSFLSLCLRYLVSLFSLSYKINRQIPYSSIITSFWLSVFTCIVDSSRVENYKLLMVHILTRKYWWLINTKCIKFFK